MDTIDYSCSKVRVHDTGITAVAPMLYIFVSHLGAKP